MNVIEPRIPRHLHSEVSAHGGVVMLNAVTGHWHVLNETASQLWRSWQSGHDLETSVQLLSLRYPEVALDRLRADASALLDQMLGRQVVEVRATEREPDAPDGTALPEVLDHCPSRTSVTLAFMALAGAALLLRLPFARICALVGSVCRRTCRAAVQSERAREITDAVDRAALRFPGRAACLEISLAAVLLAALRRRHLDWCLGTVGDPYRFHAWVEVAGEPVRDADQLPGRLRVLTL